MTNNGARLVFELKMNLEKHVMVRDYPWIAGSEGLGRGVGWRTAVILQVGVGAYMQAESNPQNLAKC